MEGLGPVINSNIKNKPVFKESKHAKQVSLPEIKQDTVDIKSKKEKNQDYGKIITALAVATGVATGGIWSGRIIYNKHFNKLNCGIKKGEIEEALYNFIKNNDPKGKLFDNKNDILEINNNLSDEKLLILKKLAKIKDETSKTNRFDLTDIRSLLEAANELNISHIEQLALKTNKVENYKTETFTRKQIEDILIHIDNNNNKIVKNLIDITPISDEGCEKLIECLKDIKADNIDTYQFLVSTRNRGGKTSLKLTDLQVLAKTLLETQNFKCADVVLNAQKKNGTGLYIHDSADDVSELLKILKEDKIDIYRKFYDSKHIDDINIGDFKPILQNLSEHNINLIDPILSKKVKWEILNKEELLFESSSDIKKLLSNIDNENNEIIEKLIEITKTTESCLIDKNDYIGFAPHKIILKVAEETKGNPEKSKQAKEILSTIIESNDPNIDLKHFTDKFYLGK